MVSRTVTVRMEKRGQIEGYSDAGPRDLATGCSSDGRGGGDQGNPEVPAWPSEEQGASGPGERGGVGWWGLFWLCWV